MKIPFKDLLQLSKDHNQIWPQDLADDLEEEDPQILQQSQTYQKLISEYFHPEENTPTDEQKNKKEPALPTLVVPGWNLQTTKGSKNWADFENLLLFYTIGKLAVANNPECQKQKEIDLAELRVAIEEFLPLKGQKRKSAEERVSVNTTYLAFGKRLINGLLENNLYALYELERELQDAWETTNHHNALKLDKSNNIASRVFKTLKKRYQKD